ncbi:MULTISPECIES: MFS transporter [Paraburkholderia]|uniref:Predicted arabinose efflux permease, MFS family n=1 Tax=Paraburkholderia phenazinium TaxID=60549 RepID=A0A1N6K172_9BURK|nr:MFS transporter [Paraburkholderia phenazinium]SIO50076.1 Predicted arabinose efflux permease, MFS family [Paraburkholderia phenazinium]
MLKEAHVVRQLVPFSAVAFLGFLAVGLPLPVLSLYVHERLGFGTLVVGGVIGLQSLATLLTRQYAGRLSDTRGPKLTSLVGLLFASLAGLFYLLAAVLVQHPGESLALLCLGRLLLGLAESLFITALAAWSIGRVGSEYAGRAMAWSGIAMYAALAVGAPLGLAIYRAAGFGAVAACAVLAPLLGAAAASTWQAFAVERIAQRTSFLRVLRMIWVPGLGMALASSGVGTISAFLPLRYSMAAWPHAGFALAAFGAAYIVMRLVLGGLPDRLGGYQTGLASLFAETIGLGLIGWASDPLIALAGATITGLGYSLVFPSLGVEAMRRVPGENRGLAIGAYLACFDLGLAIAGPGAGAVARSYGIPSAFAAATATALSALLLICVDWRWLRKSGPIGGRI